MQDRKSQIVDNAQQLIDLNGYGGFSYGDLEKALGIRKASIHHHFPKKEDLALAVLDKVTHYLLDKEAFLLSKNWSGFEKIWGLIGHGCEESACSGRICTIVSLQHDFLNLPKTVQRKVESICQLERRILSEILSQGLDKGDFRFASNPSDKAQAILAMVKGSMHYGRVFGKNHISVIKNDLKLSLCA